MRNLIRKYITYVIYEAAAKHVPAGGLETRKKLAQDLKPGDRIVSRWSDDESSLGTTIKT